MSTRTHYTAHEGTTQDHNDRSHAVETRKSTKTTEFFAYLGVVLAIVVTAFAVRAGDDGGRDPFSALNALELITYLTIGYMVACGLAKSGTRAHRNA
ncbi:MAG TPA: hypothetical protein VES95_13645 [Dermatophilaceae bacterium]|nr:hypothetical protein [Dermatophilaceae bacterium]